MFSLNGLQIVIWTALSSFQMLIVLHSWMLYESFCIKIRKLSQIYKIWILARQTRKDDGVEMKVNELIQEIF